MKMKNRFAIVIICLALLAVGVQSFTPVGVQSFTLNCPSSVEANSVFSCTLTYLSLDTANFGGLDFTISAPGYTVQGNPSSSFGSVQYNSGTQKGSLIYDFSTPTVTLLTKKFQAGRNSRPVTLPDSKFYDANSVSTDVGEVQSIVSVAATSGGCTSDWQCDEWTACVAGTQTRTCTDSNNCGTLTGKPAESQSCPVGEELSNLEILITRITSILSVDGASVDGAEQGYEYTPDKLGQVSKIAKALHAYFASLKEN